MTNLSRSALISALIISAASSSSFIWASMLWSLAILLFSCLSVMV